MRNAIQHHDLASGAITVSATIERPFCEFTVLDDGPGIEEKYRSKVFELFVTLKRRDEHEASGAGLAIAKKIVEAEGGTVSVEPREGRGTAIRFTWPLRREFERGELDSVAKKSIAEVRDKRKTLSGLYEL
jgi:signal transduction histidine kinase